MNIEIYGLLHFDEDEKSAMNVATKDFQDQVLIYVNNAIMLSKSLLTQGITFTLVTNNKSLVTSCKPDAIDNLKIIEINFDTCVPTGIRFYSAHFKLDVYRYLASLNKDYIALCDLDVVCINEYPQCLINIIKNGIPLCYDITDQVITAYGHEVIIRDLKAIHGLDSEGRWTGGEFISGPPKFFKALMTEVDRIYNQYIANLSELHHIGDEAVISSALEVMRRQGWYIADAGTLGIIGRYWNYEQISHCQKSFDYFKKCFLLHLPADKRFISDNLTKLNGNINMQFINNYEKYLYSLPLKIKKYKRIVNRKLHKLVSADN